MKLLRATALITLCVSVLLAVIGDGIAAEKKQRRPHPAFAAVKDDPALPRVLLIGDSISIGYTVPVRQALSGKANVHRAPTNCGPTIRGLEHLDRWLGDGRWDVIHFNWGIHDVVNRQGTGQQVPIDQYEKNLTELVKRLKKTGAALVWCSTTPIAPETPRLSNDDVTAYNAVARKIMEAHGVAIDDLYAFALPQLQKIQLPKNCHFTSDGSAVLARQVAASIQKAIKRRAAK